MLVTILLAVALSEPPASQGSRTDLWTERLASNAEKDRDEARAQLIAAGPSSVQSLVRGYVRGLLPQKEAISEVVAQIGESALEPLYNSFLGDCIPERGQECVRASVELAARIGKPAIPKARSWAALAGYQNSSQRLFGRGVLVHLGPVGFDALADTLASTDEVARRENIASLVQYRTPEIAHRLRAYVEDKDPVVKAYAIAGASLAADASLVEVMSRGLDDSDSLVRETSVGGLEHHYEPRFRHRLAWIERSDPRWSVRDAATRALVAQQSDPLAQRLGRRYYSQPLLLIEEYVQNIRSYFFQLATGFILLLMANGTFRSNQGQARATFPQVALALAAMLGIWWGALVRGTSGAEEESLVLKMLPICAVAGYFLRRKVRRVAVDASALRGAILRVFAAFYTSFGLGLAWVWGFLGF